MSARTLHDTPYGVALVIAYDGAEFHGWQHQAGHRTVQEELVRTVNTMTSHETTVRGASRTDAGVHAEGQVVAFDALREISIDGWVRGLNTRLPHDIAVRDAWSVPAGFEPRFEATEKSYRYLLDVGRIRSPLLRKRAWFVGRSRAHPEHRRIAEDDATRLLDVTAMRAACSTLEGTHDFRAFRAANDQRESTVRTMFEIRIETPFAGESRLVAIHVRGDAFLQHMVRILAGTLLEVGRGRIAPADVTQLLGPDARRERSGETAPALGLTLMHVRVRKAGRSWAEDPAGVTAPSG